MAVLKVVSPSGKYKDSETYRSVIRYIIDPRKAQHVYIIGRSVSSPEDAAFEMEQLACSFYKDHGTRLRHFMLSFDPEDKLDARAAYEIAWRVTDFYAHRYQIVAAVHENKPHLHIHFAMNTVSFNDGKKYSGQKKDYYDCVNYISDILQDFDLHLVTG